MPIAEAPRSFLDSLRYPDPGDGLIRVLLAVIANITPGAKEGYARLITEELTKFGASLSEMETNLTPGELESFGAMLKELKSFVESSSQQLVDIQQGSNQGRTKIQYTYRIGLNEKEEPEYQVKAVLDTSGTGIGGEYKPPLESISICEVPADLSDNISDEKVCIFRFTDGKISKENYRHELGIKTDPRDVTAIFKKDIQGRNVAIITEKTRIVSRLGDEMWRFVTTTLTEIGGLDSSEEGTLFPRRVYFTSSKSQRETIK